MLIERIRTSAARTLVLLLALAAIAYAIGFVIFIAMLDRTPADNVVAADGIVALTGGPDRINEAYKLLEEKKGARLLITGVHPEVKPNP